MVKVFFADAGTLDQLDATLAGIQTEARERLTELASRAEQLLGRTAFPTRVPLNALALRLQVDQELAILKWATATRATIRGWSSPTEPGDWDATAHLDALVRTARRASRATP